MSTSSDAPATAPAAFHEHYRRLLLGFSLIGIDQHALWAAFRRRLLARGIDGFEGVPPPLLIEVWSETYREEMPPFSAVFAGASVPLGTYEMVDYLGASCETMGDGLANLSRFFRLIRTGIEIVLDAEASRPTVTLVDSVGADVFSDEWTIGIVLARFRSAIGKEFPLATASFRRARPQGDFDLEPLRRFLGCEPQMKAAHGGFSVDRAIWNAPLQFRNSKLRESLEAHAERMLREVQEAGALAARVREVVAAELRGGDPTIEAVAKKLATAPRTLQRRLRDEGSHFQTIVEGLRSELADRYLHGEGLNVTEVAFLLGYAEASSFARAYKRWKGTNPGQARRR